MARITYPVCPACASGLIEKKLQAKDFTVSGELFDIFECNRCRLRFTQNVPDENEIGRYYQASSYISHTDTREGLINKIYHGVRNYTLGRKRKLIEELVARKTGALLDIGAGTGAFASYMRNAGWDVTGLELDAGTRERAQAINRQTLLPADALFTLNPASFDAITMWHVLEHVHALHAYLDQIGSLLREDGLVFIAVPNYLSHDARHFKEFWAAYDVPRHLYHFSPQAMKQLLEKHKLAVKVLKPMWFDSFYVSMLSEKYQKGRPANISAFFQGLSSNFKALKNTRYCSSLIYVAQKRS